ncbi:hypothetical protein [Streptomyces sp. NBC_00464]|uniref:hypothetical protein n=1 Tax=Streptomyces sp. NBC_00464 TaxID=2975751 RepID=UPI003FA73EC7
MRPSTYGFAAVRVQDSRNPRASLLALLGLQRARVRTISLRAERLLPAEQAVHQLTLDSSEDKARDLEAALDRACARYGPGIATTAAASRTAPPTGRPR